MPALKPTPLPKLPETAVQTPAQLGPCLEQLALTTRIALDTEFVGEETYRPDLCLVQVATDAGLFLIDPLTCGSLVPFWNLLAEPSRLVVVHAGREELRACQFAIGRPPANVFDVQIAAGLVGLNYPIGYGGLVQEMLNIRTSKGETLTDWRRRPLTASQMVYAFDDVRFILPIWAKLQNKLTSLNRQSWAIAEFDAAVKRAVTDEPAVEKWRKVKGLGGMSRRELAIAREVYVWRDGVAARQNRPQRTVIRDEILIEVARRAPTTDDAAAQLRGLPKALTPSLLEAVRAGQAIPAAACPELAERDYDAPHVALLASLLSVILNEWCARSKVAVGLAATMSELRAVVRARQPGQPPADATPLQTGWRRATILPELDAFLSGERSLVVADPTDPHPIRVAPV